MSDTPDPGAAIQRLLKIMARLRAPDGCSWDRIQSFETIVPYTIEEAYEVADAVGRGPEFPVLLDELGDLLFQVVYHARMAEECGRFNFTEVADTISAKMVRRHPHVFGAESSTGNATHEVDWERRKEDERRLRSESGVLAGLPAVLPALTRAAKLAARVARVGFDWPDAAGALDKLEEEAAEFRAELPAGDKLRLADEVGDLLFVLANLARKLELDPEECLRNANTKFERRFQSVEARLAVRALTPAETTLDVMEAEWQAVKRAERESE